MLKSPISVKLEKRAGEIDWIVVQRLSKKVTDEEGGRYRTEIPDVANDILCYPWHISSLS